MRQGRRIAHPPARARSPGKQTPPLSSACSRHTSSAQLLSFSVRPPPPSRRFDRGASRNNGSAGVSCCRFLMAPLFWHLRQLTSLLTKRMFLHQHRRRWQSMPPPATEAMRSRLRAEYLQRKVTPLCRHFIASPHSNLYQLTSLPTKQIALFSTGLRVYTTAGLPISSTLGPRWDGVITWSNFKSEAIFGFLSPNDTGKSTRYFFVKPQTGDVVSFC